MPSKGLATLEEHIIFRIILLSKVMGSSSLGVCAGGRIIVEVVGRVRLNVYKKLCVA